MITVTQKILAGLNLPAELALKIGVLQKDTYPPYNEAEEFMQHFLCECSFYECIKRQVLMYSNYGG